MVAEQVSRPDWKAVLYDLDGTLIDTGPGVRSAIAAAFREVTGTGDAGADADLSLPLVEMIRRLDPTGTTSRHRVLSEAFRRHYDSGDWRSAAVYEGADASLQALRAGGVRVFVVTNKRAAAAERLLEHFGLAHYFEAVVGQSDSGDPVPKAVLMAQCMASADLEAATTVVIGDSDQDAKAALSAGIAFVAVTSGAGPLGHAAAGEDRMEVTSLADASAFVLGRLRGEDLES